MRQRLGRDDTLAYLGRLEDHLPPESFRRTQRLANLIGPDQTIAMADAMAAATTSAEPKLQLAAFRMYRKALRQAVAAAGLGPTGFNLDVDGKKTSDPADRLCWFEAEAGARVAETLTRVSHSLSRQGEQSVESFALERRPGQPSAVAAAHVEDLSRRQTEGLGPEGIADNVPQVAEGAGLGADLSARRPGAHTVLALDRLMAWAADPADHSHVALLGDFGMGKTTTCRMLTRRLIEARAERPDLPLPILFDLARVLPASGEVPRDVLTLVTALLQSMPDAQTAPGEVLQAVEDNRCVVIFDGLDEVLVRLSPAEGVQFTRLLLRWAEEGRAGQAEGPEPRRRPHFRAVFSCRTHYFTSLMDEVAHFTAGFRDGPAADAFMVLVLQPFTPDQVQQYLAGRQLAGDPAGFLGEVTALDDVASHPVMLRLLADHDDLVGDRTTYPADLYDLLIASALARDASKHRIHPDHKVRLMEALAVGLLKDGAREWDWARTRLWLLRYWNRHADFVDAYSPPLTGEALCEDLRTATFIVRSDEKFRFAHASFFGYFLSGHIFRRLIAPGDDDKRAAKALRLPGLGAETPETAETLMFVAQRLNSRRLDPEARARAVTRLEQHRSDPGSHAAAILALTETLPHLTPLTRADLEAAINAR